MKVLLEKQMKKLNVWPNWQRKFKFPEISNKIEILNK